MAYLFKKKNNEYFFFEVTVVHKLLIEEIHCFGADAVLQVLLPVVAGTS